MKLFDSGVSGNCYKVRLICAHLGLPLERHELSVVDRSNRPEAIGSLSPVHRVPVLVLDDGRSMFESNAIIDYLAEDTPYIPTDPYERQQALAWQFFEQYEIEPNLAVARFLKLFEIEHTLEIRAYRPWSAGWPATTSSSATATRSPTSASTPTRTSRARAALT